MTSRHVVKIASELQLGDPQVESTAQLLLEGATVPFIARYRKEVTGGLDEVQIIHIRDRLTQLEELDKRRDAILNSLIEQDKLTADLETSIHKAETLADLEDLYLPYRPKRRTRATMAKERGLEPLAQRIFEQKRFDVLAEAQKYVDPEKEVEDVEAALAGARDIIAEWVSEDSTARARLRVFFSDKARIRAKVARGKEAEGAKYRDYFDWDEPIARAPSHRVLAILRGANEGMLTFHILPDEEQALRILDRLFVKSAGPVSEQVEMAVEDGYQRLLAPSLENEVRADAKARADAEAIRVFAENLRNLLLAAPLGQKAVLALDPGLRTGCKVVCLDAQGRFLEYQTIYPLDPQRRVRESTEVLKQLVEQHQIAAIAVGNGTGGREAESFCKSIDFGRRIPVVMVNESGASVYSASEVAREEFPDQDVTVRGAVSIGRRLMDPLSELVKIDPQSIGVGQYQHDVEPKELKTSLDDVVVSCVNAVGVEVNTASKQLLSYVSGLSERLAGNVVDYRDAQGGIRSRTELKKVKGLGPKTFEQAAGFLRIRGGTNPLDASAVHPECYGIVKQMASDLKCKVQELVQDPQKRRQIQIQRYVQGDVGLPTLQDIVAELDKPGRDPREAFELFQFAESVHEMTDLKPGMKLPGVVTNVTAFGAFVDIGVHQDGLVHISQLADRYVKDPHEVVKVHQKVTVTVLNVDLERKRIGLSMRQTQ